MMGNNSLNFKTYFSEDGENWDEIKTTKPILATGGIITNKLATIGESVGNYLHQDIDFVIPLKDKYYKIYKRTKNRRIKNKQIKKSPILRFIKEIDNLMSRKIMNEITVCVRNKVIHKEKVQIA